MFIITYSRLYVYKNRRFVLYINLKLNHHLFSLLSSHRPLYCPYQKMGTAPEPLPQRAASGALVNTTYIVTDFTRKGQHILSKSSEPKMNFFVSHVKKGSECLRIPRHPCSNNKCCRIHRILLETGFLLFVTYVNIYL